MTYPSTLSTFNQPATTDKLNSPSHSALHNTVSSAVGQIEAVVGVEGANSVVGTLEYLIKSPASDGGGHVQAANKGGTEQTSYTKGNILVAQSSSVLTKLAVGGAGQVFGVNDTTATGVSWGSVAGLPQSVLSVFPKTPTGTTIGGYPYDTTSIASIGLVNIPFPIRASIITIQANNAIDSSGTADITLYKENGSASVFTVTSPTISAIYDTYQMYLPAVTNIDSGNYYIMGNSNTGVFDLTHWHIQASVFSRLPNVAGSPPAFGQLAITGGVPPASITVGAIGGVGTGGNSSLIQGLYFRIDG